MSVAAAPKLLAYVLLTGLGLLASLALGRPEFLVLAVPFVTALAAGLTASRPPRLDLAVALEPQRVLEGAEVILSVEVVALGPVEWLELLPELPRGLEQVGGRQIVLLSLAAGEHRSLRFSVRCRHWGGYRLGDLALRVRDHGGLLVWALRHQQPVPLRVYPRPEALHAVPRPAELQAFTGNELARLSGDGIEFAEVRDFVPGDRVRSINWRVSARRGRLSANQQHPERNADVVLLLDVFGELTGPGDSTLDLAVRATEALATCYLVRRDRVGLVSFGGVLRWLRPASLLAQRYRIVEALLDTQLVLSYAWREVSVLPSGLLPPKAFIIALTPLLDQRIADALLDLRARGFDLAIIEVSPLTFLPPGRGELERLAQRLWRLRRDALRDRYRRLGVTLIVWQPGEPLQRVVEEVNASRRFIRRVSA